MGVELQLNVSSKVNKPIYQNAELLLINNIYINVQMNTLDDQYHKYYGSYFHQHMLGSKVHLAKHTWYDKRLRQLQSLT